MLPRTVYGRHEDFSISRKPFILKPKDFIQRHWQAVLLTLLAAAVFCYWYWLYPYVIVMRETAVLFLLNADYFMERIVVPGGFAQYVGESIVQFFQNPLSGAITYAVLFVLVQQLTSVWLRRLLPVLKPLWRFVLALIPSLLLWRVAMIPSVPLTPTIAVVLVLGAGCLVLSLKRYSRLAALCLLIPLMYWLAGPAALLLLLCYLRWVPLTGCLLALCVIGSSYLAPYPLRVVAQGIDYMWSEEKPMGTYEEMECDMLVRMRAWDEILMKFRNPESPAVQSAFLLATYQTGQISQGELLGRMIATPGSADYTPSVLTRGRQHLIVSFGSLPSAFMVSDIALLMNLPNISQRAVFEAMEFIPNYNKSGRALKRLVETAVITGQYALARKYLAILEESIVYRDWALSMRPLVEHPEQINGHRLYEKSREVYENTEDMFFL